MIEWMIGHYKVISKIGAGGMGEVYRARDTQLNRDVALKLLPDIYAEDPHRLSRFQREAQLLASLNHPNIAQIHGLEGGVSHSSVKPAEPQSNHPPCLVLELVEGEDLAERLTRGSITLEDAIPIAIQIAEGLEYAHERGVVHRDLKPANVKLNSEGGVKILDFGLAKALEEEPGPTDTSTSPTLTMAATQAGIIIGTAAYMSPEQARGRAADRRSDVWAFGCLLFEMLTGRKAFHSDDISETLARILRDDLEWDRLSKVPEAIKDLLERCLRKDPKKRLQSIGDARIRLEEYRDDPETGPVVTPKPWSFFVGSLATVGWVVALVSLITLLWSAWSESDQEAGFDTSMELQTRLGGNLPIWTYRGPSAVISPDGKTIALTGSSKGPPELYLRSLDDPTLKKVPSSFGAHDVFFSPDGTLLGYVANGFLFKKTVFGGFPVSLAKTNNDGGGTLNDRGEIVFAPAMNTPLYRISAEGGEPTPITQLAPGEYSHRWPHFLPGGRRLLFTSSQSNANFESAQIEALDLETGQRKVVYRGGSQPQYSSTGHLLFAVGDTLQAVKFDLNRLEIIGAPKVLISEVAAEREIGGTTASLSMNGILSYAPPAYTPPTDTLYEIDIRTGKKRRIPLGTPSQVDSLNYSPKGNHLAFSSVAYRKGFLDIWMLEFETFLITRQTFNPGFDGHPVWTKDGEGLIFASDQDSTSVGIRFKSLRSGEDTVFSPIQGRSGDTLDNRPTDLSADGRYVLYNSTRVDDRRTTSMILDSNSGEVAPLTSLQASSSDAVFSPNSDWVAFTSDASGKREVYIESFPEATARLLVSPGGGEQPKWLHGGESLCYTSGGGFFEVRLQQSNGSLRPSPPRRLDVVLDDFTVWDITNDGTRLVAAVREFDQSKNYTILIFKIFDRLNRLFED